MTVAELIDALSKYPQDLRVLVEDGENTWFREISEVVGPTVQPDGTVEFSEMDDYALPTIMFGASFDSRSI